MVRFLAPVLGSLLMLSACASGEPSTDTETATGFVFVDSAGSHVCELMAESYPPQCGGSRVKLLDLDPLAVVALMSPTDPTLAPVSWTQYHASVTGKPINGGLENVAIADPVHEDHSSGLVLRVADLGFESGVPVVLPVDLTNATDADISLTFTTGQRVEFTLSNDSGEVYRWSDGMLFTQAIEEVDLSAGATLPHVVRGEATVLPPGSYTARAWITASEAADVVVTWQVEITD